LKSELLDIEMKLQDALVVSRKQFFSRVIAINEDMKQLNQEFIQNVLNEAMIFYEKFREAAIVEHDKLLKHAEDVGTDGI
jgi:hypothetical protein